MTPIIRRRCDDAIDATDFFGEEQFHEIIETSHLVLAMGYSCTGKTATLTHALEHYSSRPVIFWNRQPILEMLGYNYVIHEGGVFGTIEKAERELIEYQYSTTDRSRVVLDGWYRMESKRRLSHQYLGKFNEGYRSTCLVFDGPQHLIVQRMRQQPKYDHMITSEIELDVRQKIETTSWPTKKEGWNQIIYVNTFGEEGIEYLQNSLEIK